MRNKRFCSLRSAFASCVRSHHANAFFFLSVRLGKMRCACTLSTDQRNQMFNFLIYMAQKDAVFSMRFRANYAGGAADEGRCWGVGGDRKRVLFSHLYMKTNILPRQARDKHMKSTQKQRDRFLSGDRECKGGTKVIDRRHWFRSIVSACCSSQRVRWDDVLVNQIYRVIRVYTLVT
jgi:hypothetical protein